MRKPFRCCLIRSPPNTSSKAGQGRAGDIIQTSEHFRVGENTLLDLIVAFRIRMERHTIDG